jgi:AcrR family transcriptional regulator
VAERAQLTRPAINHYFPNKQLLYQAVLAQAAAMFERAAEQARAEPTLIAQLSSLIASAAQLGEDDRTAAAFAVTAVVDAQRDPALRALAGDIQGLPRTFLTQAVGDAIARGELVTTSNIPELAEMLLAVLWGIAFYISLGGSQADPAGVVASLQALLTQQLWKLQQPSDDKS